MVVKKSEWENTQDSGANLLLFSAAPAILRALLKVCGEEGGVGRGGEKEQETESERKREVGARERAIERAREREKVREREMESERT